MSGACPVKSQGSRTGSHKQDSRKAAEGIRTLDLRHGKATL
jgi:hypothetical protein